MGRLTQARSVAVCVLTVAVALTPAACSSTSADSLRSAAGDRTPSPNHVVGGEAFPAPRGVSESTIVGVYVCATRTPVTITDVTLHNPSPGFVIRNWGISNQHNMVGQATGPLARLGSYRSHEVIRRCGHNRTFAEVGVELARTSTRSVHALGFDVHYVDGGAEKIRWLGLSITLQAPPRHAHTHAA